MEVANVIALKGHAKTFSESYKEDFKEDAKGGGKESAEVGLKEGAKASTPAPASQAAEKPVVGIVGVSAGLVERASALLGHGDIVAARTLLEHAALMGNAQASFALAETYDPAMLARWGTYGTLGDADKAWELYAQASAAGIKQAKERGEALRRSSQEDADGWRKPHTMGVDR
jgi:hypothetical protein